MRECYIPATKWLRYVEKFETNRYYTCHYGPEIIEQYKDRYVVPYPFKVPIWVGYVQEMGYAGRSDAEFNGDDMAKCVTRIDGRIERYLTNSVHEDVIAYIDRNSDYGVVIHSVSGRYYPFQYSATLGFSYTVGSLTGLADEMKTFYVNNRPTNWTKKIDQMNKLIVDGHGKFYMTYTPVYRYPDGDDFFNPGYHGDATEYSPLSISQVKDTRDYMNDMYAEHAKCLVIT
ncbi:MAG: hypothetical protein NC311_05870 [Muribaculaceae bacterium]|nr:hypothetical protein [Muribaculaceae bacterium]